MEIVLKEAKRVLMGIVVLDVVFVLVSIIFGFFTKDTVYGIAYSSVYCYINFVVTGYFMSKIIRKPPIVAQKQGIFLFIGKYLVMFIIMGAGVLLFGFTDYLALFVPILAPKFTYFIIAILKKEV